MCLLAADDIRAQEPTPKESPASPSSVLISFPYLKMRHAKCYESSLKLIVLTASLIRLISIMSKHTGQQEEGQPERNAERAPEVASLSPETRAVNEGTNEEQAGTENASKFVKFFRGHQSAGRLVTAAPNLSRRTPWLLLLKLGHYPSPLWIADIEISFHSCSRRVAVPSQTA